ncbi:hypothetical protein J7K41_00560 [Candidatus Micrarchaeota archaeon]|nr:hypothetical protein [Candidatus Micrarchaeota archaeon]
MRDEELSIFNNIKTGLVIALLISVFLPNVVNAIDYTDYLFEDEKDVNVTFENITVNSTLYSIMFIDGQETMVFKAGEPVTGKDEIEEVITGYYQKQYWPNEEELRTLKEDFIQFNASRNGPSKMGPAEDYCLSATFMYPKRCHTEEECEMAASTFCGIVSSAGINCNPLYLAPMFYGYSHSLDTMDELTADALENIEKLEKGSGDLTSILDELDEDADSLETTAETLLENELFDTPDCYECLGICFRLPINFTYIEDAKEIISDLKDKVEPISNMESVIDSVYEQTTKRVNYKENVEKAPVYRARYQNILNAYAGRLEEAEETLKYVENNDLAAYYNDIVKLQNKLDDEFATYSFDNATESDMNVLEMKYKGMVALLDQNLTIHYREAKSALDDATAKLVQARWYVDRSNKGLVNKLNQIGEEYNEYVEQFNPPMSDSKYDELKEEFESISKSLDGILASTSKGKNTVASFVADVSRKSSSGVLSLASLVVNIDDKTKQKLTPVIPPVLLLLGDFALIALAVFLFINIAHSHRYIFTKRMVLLSWTVLLLMFIGVVAIGSIAIYNVMKDTAREGNFDDFMERVMDSDTVAIVIDERGADASTVAAMNVCKERIINKLANKTIDEYVITGDYCKHGDETIGIDECLDRAHKNPVFILEYSPIDSGYSFKSLYEFETRMYGGTPLFDKCEVAYAINIE